MTGGSGPGSAEEERRGSGEADAPPLELSGLRKAYGRHVVLDDFSLVVAPGEAVAVVGRNGAGKSTLLEIAGGSRPPDRGRVRVGGADPFQPESAAWQRLGYVPEDPHLYDELTVNEHLGFVRAMRGLPRDRADERARLLAGALGLEGAREQPVRELSRGMRRKTALLLGLLHEPRTVLLDEPFTGLDPDSLSALRDEVERGLDAGAGVVLASHRLDLLAGLCHRGVILPGDGTLRRLEGEAWREWCSAPRLPGDGR